MYLIAGAIFLILLLIRGALQLAGFRFKPWLPPSGRPRYYADLLIAAVVLVFIAMLLGLHPSYGMALVIVLLASVAAMGLEARRVAKVRK